MFKKAISLMLVFVMLTALLTSATLASALQEDQLTSWEDILNETYGEILAEQEDEYFLMDTEGTYFINTENAFFMNTGNIYFNDDDFEEAMAEAVRRIAEIEAHAAEVDEAAFGSNFVPIVPFGRRTSAPWDGYGTSSAPFLIRTIDDLIALSILSCEFFSYYFELVNSVSFENSAYTWLPIGRGTPFMGSFDGGGNTIYGFRHTGASSYSGLFGRTHSAQISNLTLLNVDIVAGQHSGALVGYAEETAISNVSVTGTLSFDGLRTGGLVGVLTNNSTIDNSGFSDGTINSTASVTGGIAGIVSNDSIIKNSRVNADIGSTAGTTGGIAGIVNSRGSIEKTDFNGTIEGQGQTAGIAGSISDTGPIVSNRVDGTIRGASAVGGIMGFTGMTGGGIDIRNNLNRANVYGTAEVGGIIGSCFRVPAAHSSIFIRQNANHGRITANNNIAGGVIGQVMGNIRIEFSYNTGTVTTAGNRAGGLIGIFNFGNQMSGATLTLSYNAGDVSTGINSNTAPGALAGDNNSIILENWILDNINTPVGTLTSNSGSIQWTRPRTREQLADLDGGVMQPPFIRDIAGFNSGFPILDGIDYTGQVTSEPLLTFRHHNSTPDTVLQRQAGERIGALPEQPVRYGYNFIGWFDLQGRRVTADTIVPNVNTIYNARWGQNANLDQGDAYLFRLRNSNGQYMRVGGNGVMRLYEEIDDRFATDLWSIVSVGDGFYTMESLGFRSADMRSRNLLTGNSGATGIMWDSLVLRAPDVVPYGSHNQQWHIQRIESGYYFINRQNPHLMIRTGPNQAADLSFEAANAGWELEKYSGMNGRQSLISGRYAIFLQGEAVVLSIGVVTTGQGETTVDYRLGNVWNDISSKVTIHMFEHRPYHGSPTDFETWPNFDNNTTFNVIVEGRNFYDNPGHLSPRHLGAFRPDGALIDDAGPYEIPNLGLSGFDWTWGRILMSTRPDGPATTGIDQEAVFVHEIGHALKLHEMGWSEEKTQHAPYWRPVSVMNQGILSERSYILAAPSGYDRFSLIRQWGR